MVLTGRKITIPLWLEVTVSLLVAFAVASTLSIVILRASDEQRLARFGTGFLAERVASVAVAVLGAEPLSRGGLAARLSSDSMQITLSGTSGVGPGALRATAVESAVRAKLARDKSSVRVPKTVLTGLRAMYFGSGADEEPDAFEDKADKASTAATMGQRGLLVSFPDGGAGWLNVRVEYARPRASHSALLWSIGVNILAFMLVSLWISWRFASPLQRLGAAATALRRGDVRVTIHETGPRPMREAARAFNQMSTQVSATLKSQQVLMAAVAHDLRTPISVVRFRAEMVADPDVRGKLIETIDDMQAMTLAVLEAVRPEDVSEVPRQIDIAALADSLCADLRDAGRDVVFQGETAGSSCVCRATQIRRALRNLIDNAVRYGGRARVSVDVDADIVRINVDDDGPGIAPAELERVFEPFTRLENSRSRETGGYGLGLPIARLAARNHGGDVTLRNRNDGGLRATLSLSRA